MTLDFKNQRRWAVGLSLGMTAYIIVVDTLMRPLHALGVGQRVLGFVNGLSAMLQFPGFLVAINLGLRDGHHTHPAVWGLIVAVNFLMWAVGLRFVLRVLFPPIAAARVDGPPESNETDATPPARPSRRRFLTYGARLTAGGAGAVGAYSFLVETRWFEVTRRTFPLAGLPPALDGLRIVQLTDIHHGPNLSLDYVVRVVNATNALTPDLVLLTGDYVYRSPVYIEPVVQALGRLRARIAVLGVLGNHDWWEDPARTRDAFNRVEIPLIDNDRRFISPDRALTRGLPGEGVCIAGVGDYWEDETLFDDALDGVPRDMPRLLLSHNPDVAEDTRLLRHRVDLQLSGHTHGGQVRLPFLGTPLTSSRFGSKYASGLVQGPVGPVYTSCGIGSTILPLRFRVKPEITLIELRAV
ncbi:MAG: metallophosphoesterase [Tepidisphaeraceae bacterium]